jgi:hypothetical protein
MPNNTKRCFECRLGEHDNYDDDVRLVVVRDPETKKIVRRGYLCGDHRDCWRTDGYEVQGD